ncbi:AAA family ATPase [Aeromonas hydrophila]|uniref:AAA family ATPase n=1 Tax=Aeromonas hydrophila TaxID=644 RepID=UPI00076085C1|nr:AAA family ATPase [Aeromonas hydrophila]KWR67489.1 adenylylsulfate kinase [Aeromonas hydrophila]HAU4931383.1 AAA family ATPase [Aeromonas hydrophila]
MLIIFSGLPGSGKSTIARALAQRLGAVYLRIDTIEQAIRAAEQADNEMGAAGYFVAYGLARENLALGSIVITDSVNPIQLTRDAYHDIALSVGVPYLDVEVVCPNPKLHRERVENRTVDIEGLALPDWQAVIYRDYQPWNRERLVLDSATLSVEQSVERIIAALAQES